MTSSAPLRISEPLDLVAVVPYQLGFQPERSCVLMGVRAGRVHVVQRVDLPPSELADEVAFVIVEQAVRAGCTGAVLVVYEDTPERGQPMGQQTRRLLDAAGIELLEHVVVRGGRAFFPSCPPGCGHPPGGVPLAAPEQVPAVADYVAMGRRPLLSRAALADRFEAVDDELKSAVGRECHLRPVDLDASARAWGRFLDVSDARWFAGEQPGPASVAVMLSGLREHTFRDLVIAWLCPGTLSRADFTARLVGLIDSFPAPPTVGRRRRPKAATFPDIGWRLTGGAEVERSERILERLGWLSRCAPQGLRSALLTITASYAWFLGDGAVARVAVEHALAADPDYRLALLVEHSLDLGIRPPTRVAPGMPAVRGRSAC